MITWNIVEHGRSDLIDEGDGSRRLPDHSRSQLKQSERDTRIADLPSSYRHGPLSSLDRSILQKPIEQTVQAVHDGVFKPVDILRAYGKVAIKAHRATNCLTEVMIAEAEQWSEEEVNLKGPLAGIPVSLKDSITIGGFDVSVGYSRNTSKPATRDGTIARILKDAGQTQLEPLSNSP